VDPAQIGARLNQPFSQQKTRDELVIVARRAHRDGERLSSNANLERFLDGHFVRVVLECLVGWRRAPGVDGGYLNAGREPGVHGDTGCRVVSVAGELSMRIGIDLKAGWLLRSATLWSGTSTLVSG